MTYQPRRLPAPDVLRAHYVKEGMSLAEIAEKYGCSDREGVRKTLQRDAVRDGLAWPLEGVRSTRGQRMRRHHGSVPSRGVIMEINDCVKTHGVTKRELAVRAGVDYGHLVRVSLGKHETVTEAFVTKVVAGVQHFERAAARKRVAQIGLEARRAKLAREKAAGTRPLSQRDVREGRRYAA